MPFFTVFIPTYNRGYCLENALMSCERSSFRDVEIIVVDDGSSDDTAAVVEQVRGSIHLPLRYHFQKNQGKHVAFNQAVALARGELFVTLDSDDTLLPEGLGDIHALWCSMNNEQRREFAGIEFRCLENGVASSAYPEPYLDSTYAERRTLCDSRGEKRSAYRLDVLKEYPYPVFPGERYCRPGLIDMRMAKRYKTRFSNIVAIDAGHFADGIGANRRKVIASAPRAYRQYFLEEITENAAFITPQALKNYYLRYARCSFNAGVGFSAQLGEVPNKFLWWQVVLEAFLSSLADRWLVRKMAKR